jgi:hypothetical protein
VYEKKNLFLKRNEGRKEKCTVFIYVCKLKGPFSISKINFRLKALKKNYGRANVQTSNKFAMRMRKWLTKRTVCFDFFFKLLMQPNYVTKDQFLPG